MSSMFSFFIQCFIPLHNLSLQYNAKFKNCSVDEPFRIGDGYCNLEHNSSECGYDGGDCIGKSTGIKLTYPSCNVPKPEQIGNGRCDKDEEYNNRMCGWDGGDCIINNARMKLYPECTADDMSRIGDGHCDESNNSEICGWDGGDCM